MGVRVYVQISGRVQGVGFRYATADEARRRGLTGWVRNCADGSVEAEFEGPRDVLEQMVDWCKEGPALARVTNVTVQWEEGDPRYQSFSVRV